MWLYNLSRRLAFLEELFSGKPVEVNWDPDQIECIIAGVVVARISAEHFWIDVLTLNADKKTQIADAAKSGRFDNLEME